MTKLPTVTTLKSIKTTLVCLGALLFGACSDITTEGGSPDTTVDSSNLVYFAFSIHDVSSQEAGATRADRFDSDNNDYEYGTQGYIFNKGLAEEKAIYKKDNYLEVGEDGFAHFITDSPHRAFIFDNEGNKIGDLFLRGIITEDSPDVKPNEWDSYTILYTTVPEDKMLTMQATADKILVVLNAGEATLNKLQDLGDYNAIKGVVDNRENALYVVKDGTKYFTMSSSIVVKGIAGDILPYNTVKELKYYDELKDAIDNASNLEMYVERLHAKYTLLFETRKDEYKYFDSSETNAAAEAKYSAVKNIILESGKDFDPTETTLRYVSSYTRGTSVNQPGDLKSNIARGNWKVNFTGWGLNALEKEEYLFKNISSGTQYFDNWHDLDYRNFWAEDNSYNSGKYPDQYRTADDDPKVEVEAGEDANTNKLKAELSLEYYPYNRLNQQFIHQYSPESTFPTSIFSKYSTVKDAYIDQAHLRAGTHLIITAQLLINGFDDEAVYNSTATDADTGLIPYVKDKYYMNDIYWAEDAYKEYVAEYLAFWMLTDANQAEAKFGKNDGNFYVLKSGTTDVYELAKAENFQIVSANIKGGDGMVWVKPAEGTTLYLYDPENKVYKDITDSYDDLAFDHKEYFAKHYKGGRMYYPVPVRHNINGNSLTYETGDFGSVRNHWYFFTVERILTPGAPVDVPDQPIIPNNEPTTNGLGVNIKVLDWNRIGTTVEDITDQNHSKD